WPGCLCERGFDSTLLDYLCLDGRERACLAAAERGDRNSEFVELWPIASAPVLGSVARRSALRKNCRFARAEVNMAAEVKKEIQLEIAHLLFIDVVGYSKLLVNEQIELMQELNRIVRGTECFR